MDGPDPVDVHVGVRIRLRRMLLGMTQAQLGAAVGVTWQQIQKYETAANRVSASRLHGIARALGVEVAWFYADLHNDAPSSPAPAPRLQKSPPENVMDKTETLKLVRAFWRLPNSAMREAFMNMLTAAGDHHD